MKIPGLTLGNRPARRKESGEQAAKSDEDEYARTKELKEAYDTSAGLVTQLFDILQATTELPKDPQDHTQPLRAHQYTNENGERELVWYIADIAAGDSTPDALGNAPEHRNPLPGELLGSLTVDGPDGCPAVFPVHSMTAQLTAALTESNTVDTVSAVIICNRAPSLTPEITSGNYQPNGLYIEIDGAGEVARLGKTQHGTSTGYVAIAPENHHAGFPGTNPELPRTNLSQVLMSVLLNVQATSDLYKSVGKDIANMDRS